MIFKVILILVTWQTWYQHIYYKVSFRPSQILIAEHSIDSRKTEHNVNLIKTMVIKTNMFKGISYSHL